MLLPSIFEKNFVDSFFDDFFTIPKSGLKHSSVTQMNTDVQEYDDHYELDIELPGYGKENVTAELKEGYLIITAKSSESKDETDPKGKYIRRERYSGQCQRSFYVGDSVTQDDINASFQDGILKISIPKVEQKTEVEQKKYIEIK